MSTDLKESVLIFLDQLVRYEINPNNPTLIEKRINQDFSTKGLDN